MIAPLPAVALRDLLRGWQQGVESDRDTNEEYRAWVRQVVADAFDSVEDGVTPYEVMIFTVAPVFAASLSALPVFGGISGS